MKESARRPRALVVGLGIAGIATALRLHQVGWEPVIVERAPARRSNGYFILLWGTGVASARRLGVLDAIGDRNAERMAVYEVNRAGRRTPGMNLTELPGVVTPPRRVLRGDVEEALFAALPDDVEIRYSTVPTHITQSDSAAEVTLHSVASGDTVSECFDLVVGADGMRSTVRRLAFGPQQDLHPLHYMIGVTTLDAPIEGLGLHEGLVLAEPGRSAWTFPFADHAPSLLFSYHTDDIDAEFTRPAIESIRAAFGPEPPGALLEDLFARFERAPEHLFDSVHQVKLPHWHHGRVVLVGDSAWCVTLYAGMGASSAIAGSELLGTMLRRHTDDLPGALRAWEGRMRPFIQTEQDGALSMRRIFTPGDRKEQIMRTAMIRLRRRPLLRQAMGKIMKGPDLANKQFDVAAA
ncbi:FAD-dependent oxidoreductase [Nonomuraea sp. KC401]|uniref:FAD-dependent monooxygenase n=1 Tax=unclassified Nonomuraea TaxID=2593643 RepID=UPI0010FDFDCE|nr:MULTISPECIES: FAD-dependent monooxygenase [unclassified Nonomuraea]NBE92333.1 FAD-dependent oxidoreductase [Nonomuraea sp. K271]TLF81862.1 FAD-dependent oxidoreductase [Nonomuraea sp. KC401]